MNILEILISSIAPHVCLGCGTLGLICCEGCRLTEIAILPSRCYRCHKATLQNKTCKNCRKYGLYQVWAVTDYTGLAKEIIHALKFERAGASSAVIARSIGEFIPNIDTNVLITHAPTAQKRIRIRGYDQAKLIAKHLAKNKNMRYLSLLERNSQTKQVGAGRKERFAQLESAFTPKNIIKIKGSHVLIIDDVLTTGATLESAAVSLKNAGAKRVSVAVFAQA